MEPQLFSCGLNLRGTIQICYRYTFNGAATFQLRIDEQDTSTNRSWNALQWSRNFSVADCVLDHINQDVAEQPSMEPQLFSCGLQIQNRNLVFGLFPSMEPQLFSCGLLMLETVRSRCVIPSMEPQLFSCGLRKWGAVNQKWISTFNGAATFQLRIGLRRVYLPSVVLTFNGAATFQLRIAGACWHRD